MAGIGTVTKKGLNSASFNVWSLKELQILVDHFEKHPLITAKLSDFLLFKQCFEIIKKARGAREHLNEKGLLQILSIKSALNLGLPIKLKSAFPHIIETKRPIYKFTVVPNPFWISGFIIGDGSFNLSIRARNKPTDNMEYL